MLNTYASTYQKTGHIRPHPPVCLDTVTLVCTHDRTPARTDRAHPDLGTWRPSAPPCLHQRPGGMGAMCAGGCTPADDLPSPPRVWTQAGGVRIRMRY